jgi:hypothetical protein
MSAPILQNRKVIEWRFYAPQWSQRNPAAEANSAAPEHSPTLPPGLGGPNIPYPSSPRVLTFEDAATSERRDWATLDPDMVPQPPILARRPSLMPRFALLSVALMGAALAVYGLRQFDIWRDNFPVLTKHGVDMVETPARVVATTPRALKTARLVVEGRQAFAADPLVLGISLNDAAGSEVIFLNGLVTGTRVSAGDRFGIAGWRLLAADLSNATAFAPNDFVGAMDTAIELRSSSNELIDHRFVRLEWIAKPSPGPQVLQEPKGEPKQEVQSAPMTQRLDPGEIAAMLRRGNDLLKIGNIASARLMLRRAADAGNAQAAVTLAMTYDPRRLAELGAVGSLPDVSLARAWYQKAADLGSTEARRRIDELDRANRQP